MIRRSGEIEEGRNLDQKIPAFEEVGAHVEGYNSRAVGLCLVGGITRDGKPENNFTLEQWQSLERLVKELKVRYPNAEVLGHRDFPGVNKACPCFDAKAWWKQVTAESH